MMHGVIAAVAAQIVEAGGVEIVASGTFNENNPVSGLSVAGEGAVADDVLLLIETNDIGNPSTPLGFSVVSFDTGDAPEMAVTYRVLTASNLTNGVAQTAFPGQNDASGVYLVLRNAGTPVANTQKSGTGSTYTWNSITCTVGSLLLAVVHLDDDYVTDGSWGDPSASGWAKLHVGNSVNSGANVSSTTYVASKVATSTSEDPGSLTTTFDQWITQIIEIPIAT